jgi:Uma2 family endonuclease
MNLDDFLCLPDDEKIYEIIDGELHNRKSPSVIHQAISRNIEFILHSYTSREGLDQVFHAPIGVVLSYEDVVQPDIIYIRKSSEQIIHRDFIRGVPDLVVEILSRGREDYDTEIKRKLYEKYKVSEYWIVDPERSFIEVFRLKEDRFERIGVFTERDEF